MPYPNNIDNFSAAIQAEMRKSVIQCKQQKAPTLGSFKSGSGARTADGRLVGLEIPLYEGVPHGETALDVLSGRTSFDGQIWPQTNKMFVGLTQTGFTTEYEYFHNNDAEKGLLPETRETMRDKLMLTYYQHQNWYIWGKGNGTLAIATTTGGSGTRTFAYDNTARERSKGSLRLAVSWSTTAGKRVMYESYNTSTDALGATFYLTSKPNATQAVVVVTDAGTITAGEVIVKAGHYKRVSYGLGYHVDITARLYQGVNTTNDPFLNSQGVDCGNALVTPTVMDSAKGATQVIANDANARKNRICHMTIGNYKTLAGFGYTLRKYNAEKGEADTTFGLPFVFEDEDTVYIQDADGEEAYIYMRDRKSYFIYQQREMAEISKGATQYVGTNSRGSTEFFQNYGEAKNLAWDGRGDDGQGESGSANSSVVLYNIAMPALTQVSRGVSLV